MVTSNKSLFVTQLNRIIATLQKDYVDRTFQIDGKTWKTVDIVTLCQNTVASITAVEPAKVVYSRAVTTQKTDVAAARALVVALKGFIGATAGKTSDAYKSFGFGAKPVPPTAETKVAANKQRAATRAARSTMGKRQRKAIKGAKAPATAQPVASTSTSGK